MCTALTYVTHIVSSIIDCTNTPNVSPEVAVNKLLHSSTTTLAIESHVCFTSISDNNGLFECNAELTSASFSGIHLPPSIDQNNTQSNSTLNMLAYLSSSH